MTSPKEYIQADNLSRSTAPHFIDEFQEELSYISGKCMDVGCGPGDVTRYSLLPALNAKVTVDGTDISKDMIKHAKELHVDEKRLKFEMLDIETKHLPEKYVSEYNHVFSYHVLHWCMNIRQAFENIYRLLQPGGTMLIVMVIYHDVFDILHKLSQNVRYSSYVTHSNNFIPPFYHSVKPHEELKMLVQNVGFNVLHCSHRERKLTAQHIEELPNMILSFITQHFENMPSDRMEQFKNDFTEECRRRIFSHKQIRNNNERTASDLDKILVVYAQKNST